jgi:tRNA pseudouridine55 synthase
MDGKPLYEYAREHKPLPRPIPTRRSKVEIELLEFTPASRTPGDGGHEYKWPTGTLSDEQKSAFKQLNELAANAPVAAPQPINRGQQLSKKALKALKAANPAEAVETTPDPEVKEAEEAIKMELPDLDREPVPEVMPSGAKPPIVKFKMTVSSGTYVRSIVHDIGLALGSAAHVVTLTRTRQKQFSLYGDEAALEVSEAAGHGVTGPAAESADASKSKPEVSSVAVRPGGCVPWAVWERAIKEHEALVQAEQSAYAEAVKSGMSEEELDMEFSPKALWEKRRSAGLKEWEVEVMKRFVDVDA